MDDCIDDDINNSLSLLLKNCFVSSVQLLAILNFKVNSTINGFYDIYCNNSRIFVFICLLNVNNSNLNMI